MPHQRRPSRKADKRLKAALLNDICILIEELPLPSYKPMPATTRLLADCFRFNVDRIAKINGLKELPVVNA